MSIPSDSTEREGGRRARASQLTPEQRGLAVAALVAFLGITYLGPALTRLVRRRRPKERTPPDLRDIRRQSLKLGGKVRERARRFGGPIRP